LHFSLSVFVLQLLKNSSLYVSITAKTGWLESKAFTVLISNVTIRCNLEPVLSISRPLLLTSTSSKDWALRTSSEIQSWSYHLCSGLPTSFLPFGSVMLGCLRKSCYPFSVGYLSIVQGGVKWKP
jgi:hypothetical protein